MSDVLPALSDLGQDYLAAELDDPRGLAIRLRDDLRSAAQRIAGAENLIELLKEEEQVAILQTRAEAELRRAKLQRAGAESEELAGYLYNTAVRLRAFVLTRLRAEYEQACASGEAIGRGRPPNGKPKRTTALEVFGTKQRYTDARELAAAERDHPGAIDKIVNSATKRKKTLPFTNLNKIIRAMNAGRLTAKEACELTGFSYEEISKRVDQQMRRQSKRAAKHHRPGPPMTPEERARHHNEMDVATWTELGEEIEQLLAAMWKNAPRTTSPEVRVAKLKIANLLRDNAQKLEREGDDVSGA